MTSATRRLFIVLSCLTIASCSDHTTRSNNGDAATDAGFDAAPDSGLDASLPDSGADASSGFTLTGSTPPSASRTVDTTLTITGTNLVSSPSAPTIQLIDCASPTTAYDLVAGAVNSVSITTLLPADVTRVAGTYTIRVTNGDGAIAELTCALVIVAESPPTVTDVVGSIAWQGSPLDTVVSDESVTITGTGFASTPNVRFVSTANPSSFYDAPFVGFVSSTTLTVVVPSESAQMAAGTYDVFVTNPDQLSAEWMIATTPGVFMITATPPPRITDAMPSRVAQGVCTSSSITITGTDFDASASLWYVVPNGTVCVGSSTDAVGRTLCPIVVDSIAATGDSMTAHLGACPANGPYPLVVRNPDGRQGEFDAIEITPNANGALGSGSFTAMPNGLATPRWKHAAQFGFDSAGHPLLYVAGGQDAAGNVLGSVELGALDEFGTPGPFRTLEQYGGPSAPRIPNVLGTPRIGSTLVRVGASLFSIGGSTLRSDTTTAVAASAVVERAEILGAAQTPTIQQPISLGFNGLPTGAWYYQVSAIGLWGESLPSSEVVARNVGGQLEVCWTGPSGAVGYNVYRSLASDGRTGTTAALAYEVPGPCFTDDGLATSAPAPGNATSSLAAGGTLGAGSYRYRISAVVPLNGGGTFETYASYPTVIAIGSSDVSAGNQSVSLSWDAISGVGVTYRVYRFDDISSTYQLLSGADGLTSPMFVDSGVGFDPIPTTPRTEIRPLDPGSLSTWNTTAPALHHAREGLDGVAVHLDPATAGGLVARILVSGGRDGTSGAYVYLPSSESLGVHSDGSVDASWTDEAPVLTHPRAYYALLSTQARNTTPYTHFDPGLGSEPVYILAALGDDAFSAINNTGRMDVESCAIDMATGHLASDCGVTSGTTWIVQTTTDPQSTYAHDAVLYFSNVYPFYGVSQETVGSTGSTIALVSAAVVQFPLNDLTAIVAGQVVSNVQSTSSTFVTTRAYYQMLRLSAYVYVLGGTTAGGPTGVVERHQQ